MLEMDIKLFKRAKKEIMIVGGNLNNPLYESSEVLKVFEEVVSRDVKIEIICGPEINPNTKKLLTLCKEHKNIYIFQTNKKNAPKAHFAIVDNSAVKLEYPYKKRTSGVIEAVIIYNAELIANELLQDFKKIKDVSKKAVIPKDYLKNRKK